MIRSTASFDRKGTIVTDTDLILQHLDQSADKVIHRSARVAARLAAKEILRERKSHRSEGVSVFALYMWGSLTAASMLLALGSGVFAPVNGPQGSDDPRLVSNEPDRSTPKNSEPVAALLPPITGVGDSGLRRDQSQPEKIVAILDSETTGAISREEIAPTFSIQPKTENTNIIDQSPAEKFAASIGIAKSVTGLGLHYVSLERRAPQLFAGLDPRFEQLADGSMKLIAGPFANVGELAAFCRSVRLQLTIECTQTGYFGQPVFAQE